MANTKISELPQITTAADADKIPIVNSGNTSYIEKSDLKKGMISPGFISAVSTISGLVITYAKPKVEVLGALFESTGNEVVTISGSDGWYAVTVDESTGAWSFALLSTLVTISGNQLNMYSVYDHAYNYCRSGGKRIVMVTQKSGSSLLFQIPINNKPFASFKGYRGSNLTLTAATVTNLQPDTIYYDLNSGWDTVNHRYVPNFAQKLTGSAYAENGNTTTTSERLCRWRMSDGTNTFYTGYTGWSATTASAGLRLGLTHTDRFNDGDYFDFYVYSAAGTALVGSSSNSISIQGDE